MWTHFINDNEKFDGKKGLPTKGRYILHIGENYKSITLSWSLFASFCAIGFDFDDDDWTFRFCIPYIISLWLSFENFKFLYKISPKKKCIATWDNDREFYVVDSRACEICIHDWTLWIKPWAKKNEWNSEDPFYVNGISFHFDEYFLGETRHKREIQSDKKPIIIPMPEGTYEGFYTIEKSQYWRSYFPFLKDTMYFAQVEIPKGIPFNGKGENSWDCGTNGLFGISVRINNMYEAESKSIAKVVESVTSSRLRYGTPSAEEIEKWRNNEIV